MIPRIRSRFIAAEHGFSMIIVMGVMAASALFVAAAFSAANGDLPLTRDSQDRKQAYAAAEAGVEYYLYQLARDNDYWTKCDQVEDPVAAAGEPVLQGLHAAAVAFGLGAAVAVAEPLRQVAARALLRFDDLAEQVDRVGEDELRAVLAGEPGPLR